jgi:hypothetical protein
VAEFGEADRMRRPKGDLDAGAASWTMKGEEDSCLPHRAVSPMSQSVLWPGGWSGAGVPGGASPRPEPGAGSAGRGAAGAALTSTRPGARTRPSRTPSTVTSRPNSAAPRTTTGQRGVLTPVG